MHFVSKEEFGLTQSASLQMRNKIFVFVLGSLKGIGFVIMNSDNPNLCFMGISP